MSVFCTALPKVLNDRLLLIPRLYPDVPNQQFCQVVHTTGCGRCNFVVFESAYVPLAVALFGSP